MGRSEGDELRPIGALAQQLGVTHRALRFYEDRKLLTSTVISGVRYYDGHQCHRAAEIVRLRGVGLTLTQIGELLRDTESAEGRERLKDTLERQIEELERQRHDIERALEELRQLL